MKPETESVIKGIVISIRKLIRAVSVDSQKIGRRYGLTGPQSGVLRSLVRNGPKSSADLSRKLYVTPSNITGIIDRLEKKGLVDRIKKEGDRRVSLINLTETGAALGRSMPDPIEKRLISELADLDPEEVRLLDMAINQILDMLDTQDIEETPLGLDKEITLNRLG